MISSSRNHRLLVASVDMTSRRPPEAKSRTSTTGSYMRCTSRTSIWSAFADMCEQCHRFRMDMPHRQKLSWLSLHMLVSRFLNSWTDTIMQWAVGGFLRLNNSYTRTACFSFAGCLSQRNFILLQAIDVYLTCAVSERCIPVAIY